MKNKKLAFIIGILTVSIIGILITLYLLNSQQDVRSRAECEEVPKVTNVLVDYPACIDDECTFTDASCSWDPNLDAVSYRVKVTEVESGTVVIDNQTYSSETLDITFPVTQNMTYKCEVVATNSCGNVSEATSHQLLCANDALITSPTPIVVVSEATPTLTATPTASPTATITPTNIPGVSPSITPIATVTPTNIPTATPTLIPTNTPSPTMVIIPTSTQTPTPTPHIVPTGAFENTIAIIGFSLLAIIGGMIFFML